MKPLADCRLYAFIDLAYLDNRAPTELAKQLSDGGADLIQLRAKSSSEDDIRRMTEKIAPILESADVHLVVNDHPAIAGTTRHPFCHLGQEDFFEGGHRGAAELSRFVQGDSQDGRRMMVGLSTHSPEQARRALGAAPDYIAIGPVYPTATKPTATPVTLDYVRWAADEVPIPWFAIGGIDLDRLPEVLEAGATRICVVSAILRSKDVAKTCQEFRRRLPS